MALYCGSKQQAGPEKEFKSIDFMHTEHAIIGSTSRLSVPSEKSHSIVYVANSSEAYNRSEPAYVRPRKAVNELRNEVASILAQNVKELCSLELKDHPFAASE